MAIRFLNSGNISGNLEVNKSANAAVEIAKFKVTGTGGSFGAFSFVSILPGSGNFATQLRLHTNNTGNAFQSINNNAGVLELATNDSNPLVLKTNSTTRLTISNVGAATFTGLVSGITPTAAANFVTKAYADGLAPGSGVFLPLAGGTMSGNINMGDRKITNINEMSFGANAYITSPSNFLVRFNQTSVDVPSGDAIFGGTVIEDPNSLARKIEIAAADPVGLILNDTRDTHPITIANEGAVLNLKYNTTSMLSIDGATSNATFNGGLTVNAGNGDQLILNNAGDRFTQISLQNNGTTEGALWVDDTDNEVVLYANTGKSIEFHTNGQATPKLTLASGGAATFAGNVKIGSSTTGTPATQADDLVIDKGASESGITLISTAAASIRFGDAANTSIGSIEYNHNSNYLRFSTNNAERMRIADDGSVRIGKSTNYSMSSPYLMIGNSANTNELILSNQGTTQLAGFDGSVIMSTGGSNNLLIQSDNGYLAFGYGISNGYTSYNEAMRIDTSGNVGIATTTPGSKLTVNGQVQVSTGAARRYALQPSQWGYASSYRTLILGSASTSYNTNDTGSVTLAFGVDVSGNPSGSFTGNGSELIFRNGAKFITPNTANNGYNSNTLVLLDGKVGIGTASPEEKLQVAGKTIINSTGNYTSNAGSLSVNSNSNANGGIVDTHSNGNHRYYTRVAHGNTGSSAAGYWHVKTNINVSASIMFLAKFYGFVYGQSAIVDLQHTGYAYTGGSVIAQGTTNNSSVGGMSSAIYLTAANEVCFRIDLGGSTYYAGLWMDVGFQNPTGGATNLLIQGTAWSTTANYYT